MTPPQRVVKTHTASATANSRDFPTLAASVAAANKQPVPATAGLTTGSPEVVKTSSELAELLWKRLLL